MGQYIVEVDRQVSIIFHSLARYIHTLFWWSDSRSAVDTIFRASISEFLVTTQAWWGGPLIFGFRINSVRDI